jgi:TIR domain
MPDVFMSYAREDIERARKLASALEAGGWSAWWDRNIIAGQTFDQVIEHELETAKCVVVLWSKDSIFSEWVKNEAAAAAERGVLVPALIDNVKLPLEFRRKQTANLVGWDGNPSHEGFQALCDAVATKATNRNAAPRQSATVPPRGFWQRRWLWGASVAIAVGIIAALIQSGIFRGTVKPPVPVDKPSPSVVELESQLKVANIKISSGDEKEAAKVRGYLGGPDPAYRLLAANCIQVLANRRLKETGYLDMIDDFYTRLVGQENFGTFDHEKLKEGIIAAHNHMRGKQATSIEEITEPIP